MSNGIAMRQNEDNSIAMLAAQRQLCCAPLGLTLYRFDCLSQN